MVCQLKTHFNNVQNPVSGIVNLLRTYTHAYDLWMGIGAHVLCTTFHIIRSNAMSMRAETGGGYRHTKTRNNPRENNTFTLLTVVGFCFYFQNTLGPREQVTGRRREALCYNIIVYGERERQTLLPPKDKRSTKTREIERQNDKEKEKHEGGGEEVSTSDGKQII